MVFVMEKMKTASFCTNSNVWLAFLGSNPLACPYSDNYGCENCGYHKDKPITAHYKRKMKILKSYGYNETM